MTTHTRAMSCGEPYTPPPTTCSMLLGTGRPPAGCAVNRAIRIAVTAPGAGNIVCSSASALSVRNLPTIPRVSRAPTVSTSLTSLLNPCPSAAGQVAGPMTTSPPITTRTAKVTKQEEVAKWREIGQAFERLSVTGTGPLLVTCGLCYAMQLSRLPAYYGHARLTTEDHHGPCLQWNGRFGSGRSEEHTSELQS